MRGQHSFATRRRSGLRVALPVTSLPSQRRLNSIYDIDHRAIEDGRSWYTVVPPCTLRVDSDEIPQIACAHTAFVFRLWRPSVRGHLFCEEVTWIPVLLHAGIGGTTKREGRRRAKVGRQNRLPHHEHARGGSWVRRQDRLNCGGPPQTLRSSRREEHDHTAASRCAVELSFQRTE